MHKLAEWYYGKEGELSVEEFSRWCRFLARYRLTPKNIGYEYVKRSYKKLPNGVRVVESVDMSALKQTLGELSSKYFAPYSYGLYRLPSGPTVEKGLEAKLGQMTPQAVAQPVKLHFEEWQRQGFAEAVYVYGVDEPVGEEVFRFLKETYSLIKQAVPTCKIMQTGNCNNPRLVGLVDIWCPKTTIARDPFFQQRLAAGEILWQYVCVSPVPPSANFFVDEPAIDHRVLFWQTKQIGATGLLYWAVIWWSGLEPTAASSKPCFPEVPLDFRQHELFKANWQHVNGDGVLLYPGKDVTPLPSIRLEVIRDGIEDFEYITLLENLTAKVKELPKYKTAETRNVIAAAEALCNVPETISRDVEDFTRDPEVIFARRKAVGDMIEQLVNVLEEKDYERWTFGRK